MQTSLKAAPHRNSHPEVFLEKGILKMCNKFQARNQKHFRAGEVW